ncbi:hypothetical protein AGDE_05786 [Angomonas deanei]|nr:hypothetical protein AGDE_05786 [Angomonas deanei]|eukprot:EPY38145.1 hypothetical protein AGDE_05786 [Angomonas deanei]
MQYPATAEHNNPQITPQHPLLYKCLNLVYELYGVLADDLHELHDDPLHPRFHQRIKRIREDREKIAKVLDEQYAALHPTVKTVYDAFLVRRYYHLEDWIKHVERKREKIFETLSPEFINQAAKAADISSAYMERLKQLESLFVQNPTLGMLSENQLEQYTDNELAMLKQKATYFRKLKKFGANQLDSDIHTH